MARRDLKKKMETAGQQQTLPGHKDPEILGFGRNWLIAKGNFNDAREKLQDAGKELAVYMKKQNIPSFVCEGERINLKVIEEKIKVTSAPVED